MRAGRLRPAAALALASALGGGCTPAPPRLDTPDGAALALFALAARGEPATDELEAWFGVGADDPRRAELLDALAALPRPARLTVTGTADLAPAEGVAVDLRAELAGGGEARYEVQLRPAGRGDGWTIRWFGGPGIEWPRLRGRGRTGLSTSAPPAPADGGSR